MTLEEALQRLLADVTPVAEVERVPTQSAAGRVLAEPVVSALDVPGFDNSQMDGYAVRCAEVTSSPWPAPHSAAHTVSMRALTRWASAGSTCTRLGRSSMPW